MGITISAPVKLEKVHYTEEFNCGQPILDRWLNYYALQNQQAGAANTFIIHQENRVIGFYSLSVGGATYEESPERIRKGLARHPVPVMILARLAVDKNFQGKRLGRGLLRDALHRTFAASEHAGIRAMLVHAKNEDIRNFYEQYGFEPSPVDPLKLMLLLKDTRKIFITSRTK